MNPQDHVLSVASARWEPPPWERRLERQPPGADAWNDEVAFVGVYSLQLDQRYTSRGDPRPPSWGVLYDLPNENASSQLSTRFSPSPALGSSYCQLVERCVLVAYTILPYYYPTRSRVSTRSSLCPTAVLLHPLVQYVDPIALLACLLDPLFCIHTSLTKY